MTAPDASGLTELGISATDADLLEAARGESAIAAEVSERRARTRVARRRAGPLQGADRSKIVAEASEMLTRATLALLIGCDTPVEVDGVLARSGLELRRSLPNPDHLAGWLQGRLKK